MEIISYVLEGELAHRDSMGNGSVIRRGDVQRMTAGTGVEHSEFNHSQTEPVHFFQIWLFPDRRGLRPATRRSTSTTTRSAAACGSSRRTTVATAPSSSTSTPISTRPCSRPATK